jgi:hypothetical protein
MLQIRVWGANRLPHDYQGLKALKTAGFSMFRKLVFTNLDIIWNLGIGILVPYPEK